MKTPGQVSFRVDASFLSGSGHVMRCLTLAHALRAHNVTCRFICRPAQGNLISFIQQQGFDVLSLPALPSAAPSPAPASYAEWLGTSWQQDAADTLQALSTLSVRQDWLVVDHYAIDEQWEQQIQHQVNHILVIDDLLNRRHHADLLLDQTLGRDAAEYAPLVNPQCRVLCGIAHVLLREEFCQWRQASLAHRQQPSLAHIVISLGGVDKDNVTRRILLALHSAHITSTTRITVVLGNNSPWQHDIAQLLTQFPATVSLVAGTNRMAELLARCDLCIGAAGTSAWERCHLGIPTLLLVLADNQQDIADKLTRAGAVFPLDAGTHLEKQVIHAIQQCMQSPALLHDLSQHASELVPTSGTSTLTSEMLRKMA